MRLPDIGKRVAWLMEAIDKNVKTDLPKTEDQYMALVASLVRPIVRRVCAAQKDGRDEVVLH